MKRPPPSWDRLKHMPAIPARCVPECRRCVITDKFAGFCSAECRDLEPERKAVRGTQNAYYVEELKL